MGQVDCTFCAGTTVVARDCPAIAPIDISDDTTYIAQGAEHAFRNRGEEPMTILWIYCSDQVTRTLSASGETVDHLSARDRIA
jgi:oxalate decarboxylase/phosphoglucose isomerase-like protein (cupin superfamily)